MNTFAKNKDFIFEIIHDLKAPLMSMDYALKNIQRDEILEEVYKLNRHNLSYVESMLSGYSIEKGKYCPKYEIVNPVKIVKEEIKVLKYLIKDKNIRVITSVDKIDEGYIISDKYLTRQIILNLLANAVKYAPDNSDIRIIFEKRKNCFSICFSNKYDKNIYSPCSSKIGLEIVKKKLKALRGKLEIKKSGGNICFKTCFQSAQN